MTQTCAQSLAQLNTWDKLMGTLELSAVVRVFVFIFSCCASLGGLEIN
jgi:hypothetical protein